MEVGAKSGSVLTLYRHFQFHSNKEFQKTSHLRGQWYLAMPLTVLHMIHSGLCFLHSLDFSTRVSLIQKYPFSISLPVTGIKIYKILKIAQVTRVDYSGRLF